MPVSGLVVTLAPPGPEADRAFAWLREDDRFALGDPEPATPRRLPVTLDTPDRAADKRTWVELQDHPGIDFVDVACVFFEEDAAHAAADTTADAPAQSTYARSRP